MSEGSPASPACPRPPCPWSSWRRETLESLEATAWVDSLDPEATKVFLAFPGVRVCLDFLVLPSRAKDSLESQGIPVSRAARDSLGPRVKLASWGSLACLDPGETMELLDSLETLESLVVLVGKVCLEIHLGILEVLAPKGSLEIQASQQALAAPVLQVTTAFQEVQDSLEPREHLVKAGGLE